MDPAIDQLAIRIQTEVLEEHNGQTPLFSSSMPEPKIENT
jgi:hypothetical protein